MPKCIHHILTYSILLCYYVFKRVVRIVIFLTNTLKVIAVTRTGIIMLELTLWYLYLLHYVFLQLLQNNPCNVHANCKFPIPMFLVIPAID